MKKLAKKTYPLLYQKRTCQNFQVLVQNAHHLSLTQRIVFAFYLMFLESIHLHGLKDLLLHNH